MGEQPKVRENSIDLVSFDSNEQFQMEVQSINSFYALAQESLANKKYRIAIIYLRKILQIDNTYLPAYKMLAKIFQIRKQYDRAAEILRQAVDIKFRDAEIHYQLGYIYFLQGNEAGFARECTKALVVNPNYSKAFYALALLHYKNKRYDKAKTELDKCLQLNPHDGEARQLLADVLIHQRDFESARKALEEVLKYDPQNEKANLYLGEIAFLLKDYAMALDQYLLVGAKGPKAQDRIKKSFAGLKKIIDRRLQRNPGDLEAQMDLATLYYQVDNFPAAKKVLEACLSKFPAYLPARINYGLMLIYENKFLEGIKIYQEVLKASPMSAEAKYNLDKAYELAEDFLRANYEPEKNKRDLLEIYMLQEKYDLAVLVMLDLNEKKYAKEILQKVSSKNINSLRIYQGAALFLLGETKEAEYLFGQLTTSQSASPALNYFLGLIEKNKGNLVEAYKLFEKVKNLKPDYWFIDRELNNIAHRELQLIEKALQSDPNNLKLNLEYIDLLALTGFYKKALQHLIKIKKSDLGVVDFTERMNKVVSYYENELEAALETERPSPETYLDLGEIYLYKKRYYEAFLLFQNVRKQFPSDHRLKEFFDFIVSKSIQVYQELLKTQRTTVVYYNLAVLYAVVDKRNESLLMLKEAVTKDKKLAIQARYEDAFKKYRFLDKFQLITLIEGEDKNIYRMQD